jgi:hypothetical protein
MACKGNECPECISHKSEINCNEASESGNTKVSCSEWFDVEVAMQRSEVDELMNFKLRNDNN